MEGSRFKLSLPLKAEYVSIARLTVSGIANRAGFDFYAIEDIKVSLSEVCNRLINDLERSESQDEPILDIEFIILNDCLTINFWIDNGPTGWALSMDADEDEKLGLLIVQVLMDEFETNTDNGYIVSMMKEVTVDYSRLENE